jgi:PhnB protein
MSTAIKSLVAYLNFRGDCEEALNHYANIFDGKVTIANRYDNPTMNVPKEFRDKVLHATLEFAGITVMASDIIPKNPGEAIGGSGDAALSLDVSNPEEGNGIFGQLAEGGKVNIQFEKQFWGAWHGNLRDKYGIRWMVNCEG